MTIKKEVPSIPTQDSDDSDVVSSILKFATPEGYLQPYPPGQLLYRTRKFIILIPIGNKTSNPHITFPSKFRHAKSSNRCKIFIISLCYAPSPKSYLQESNPPCHNHLPTPHSRTRRRIARRHRIVNVNHNTRISRLVRSRERHRRTRATISAILHLDLRTRDVELRTTSRAR
jgi:hypothetical protein